MASKDLYQALLKKIGANVRSRRQKLGLTLEKLEKASGIDWGSIAEIERGKVARRGKTSARDPRLSTLVALASGLKCNICDLFPSKKSHPQPTLDSVEARILRRLRDFNPKTRSAILAIAGQIEKSFKK